MLPQSKLGWSLAGAGLCFVGYCVYFDYKRRSDPDFKTKLIEKRKKSSKKNTTQKKTTKFPPSNDAEACQRFFLQEVQLGEELLAQGDIEGGVEHLSNSIAVCGQPHQLLQVLQQTLPPQVFQLLVMRLQSPSMLTKSGNPASLDDLE